MTRRARNAAVAATICLVVAACASDDIATTDVVATSTTAGTTPAASTTSGSTTSIPTTDATPATTASAPPPSTPAPSSAPGSPPELGSKALIDLSATTLAGGGDTAGSAQELGVLDDIAAALGAPTDETGWRPMPPTLACTGSDEYRSLHWDDLRLVIERSADSGVFVGAWSLGVGDPIAPPRVVPLDPTARSGVTTTDGVGIGDPATDITGVETFVSGDRTLVAPGVSAIVIRLDDGGLITGFASGRNDCLARSIASIDCNRPIPVGTLPNGEPAGEASIDDGAARWGVDLAEPDFDNVITEVIGGATDDDLIGLARTAPISASNGPLRIGAVPVDDPPSGQTQFYLFDDRTDCVRLFLLGGLGVDQLQQYADTLVVEWYNPR